MIISVVNEDRAVRIDGKTENFDLELDANIWAIQWDGTNGEIEYYDDTPNKMITNFSDYQYLIDKHSEEKTRRIAAEAAAAGPEPVITYKEKREAEYPVMGDQFDMLWHAIDDGVLDKTSDFYTALKVVKDKYPKE